MNEIPPPKRPIAPRPPLPLVDPATRITIVDLQIPFGRMVAFMVKWAFAAIPALIIVWVVCAVIFIFIAMFFGGMAALIQAVTQHHP